MFPRKENSNGLEQGLLTGGTWEGSKGYMVAVWKSGATWEACHHCLKATSPPLINWLPPPPSTGCRGTPQKAYTPLKRLKTPGLQQWGPTFLEVVPQIRPVLPSVPLQSPSCAPFASCPNCYHAA